MSADWIMTLDPDLTAMWRGFKGPLVRKDPGPEPAWVHLLRQGISFSRAVARHLDPEATRRLPVTVWWDPSEHAVILMPGTMGNARVLRARWIGGYWLLERRVLVDWVLGQCACLGSLPLPWRSTQVTLGRLKSGTPLVWVAVGHREDGATAE